MSIYNAIASPLEGHKITFPDSIDFIIEAMAPSNDIFEESGELRALPCPREAAWKKEKKRDDFQPVGIL